MLVRDTLHEAARQFSAAGSPSPRLDAEVLLSFVLGCERLEFIKNPLLSLEENAAASFWRLAGRRQKGEPVAYITGRKEFWSFVLEVDKAVLIPRPDTEVLVEETLDICTGMQEEEIKILDIGTGSGAIALALACEIRRAKITATDVSTAALKVAAKNAHNLHLDKRIEFREGNLFQPVSEIFDIIVSNPPYIAEEEYAKLPCGVKDFEPREALWAGPGGMDFYRRIIEDAPAYLRDGGRLVLEIGALQSAAVQDAVAASGRYGDIRIRNDYAGLPRVIRARRIGIG